jgi:two-component system, sensor histidine kinase and response regulator
MEAARKELEQSNIAAA